MTVVPLLSKGLAILFELNRSINPEWPVFGICHFSTQSAIRSSFMLCRIAVSKQQGV
jgi:hypothetical protein